MPKPPSSAAPTSNNPPPDLQIAYVDPKTLLESAKRRAAKVHSPEKVAALSAVLLEVGTIDPIMLGTDGVVLAGRATVLAAIDAGFDRIPVIDVSHLTEAQQRTFALAHNALAARAGYDTEFLHDELKWLEAAGVDLALTGFSDAELEALMAPLGEEEEASNGDDDAADETPAPPRQPVTRLGDLWLIGRHRLLCGNSADTAVVSRVMEGKRASLVFTSPPYGNQRDYTTGGVGDWDALMQGVFKELPVTDEAQVLVNLGLIHRDNEWQPYWQSWLEWMREQGWRRFGLYAWDQGPGLPGDWNGRLAPAFELLFHFNRVARKPNKIVPCKWAGHINDTHGGMRSRDGHVGEWSHAGQGVQDTRIPDSVVRITRHKARGIETEHPAVFPVALPEFMMRAYSNDREIIYEPFAGSGTSIIAAERAGRCMRAIEIAPEYVDVALRRWRKLFPDQPVKLDGEGQTFEAVARQRGVAIPSDD